MENINTLYDQQKDLENQLERFYTYLQENTVTSTMASKALAIPQKNLTRFKRKLEIANRLWEVDYKYCEHTGHLAWYLSTNPNLKPFDNQLKMFLT